MWRDARGNGEVKTPQTGVFRRRGASKTCCSPTRRVHTRWATMWPTSAIETSSWRIEMNSRTNGLTMSVLDY